MRRSAAVNLLVAIPVLPCGDDEDVLEAGVRALDLRVNPFLVEYLAQLAARIVRAAIDEHAQPYAELRHAVDPGNLAQDPRRLAAVRAFDFEHIRLDAVHEVARRALGDDATLGQDGEAVTALGLIHVMSGHEDSGAGL